VAEPKQKILIRCFFSAVESECNVHSDGEGVIGVLVHVNMFIGVNWLLKTEFTTKDPNHSLLNDLQSP
jgi:hypothetical protein